jgi:hypothetical protein
MEIGRRQRRINEESRIRYGTIGRRRLNAESHV